MDLYILEWDTREYSHSGDEDHEDTFEIIAFGKTETGQSVVARVRFFPYMFVKVPQHWSLARQKLFVAECVRDLQAQSLHSCPVVRKDAWGYSEQDGAFVQLSFNTLKHQKIAKSRLSNNAYEIYEGNVDPIIRFCHVRKVSPTGWISVRKWSQPERVFQRADIEIACDFTDVHPCADSGTREPPLVLCSWDIEVFSHDGSFPTADHPENKVIQIAAAFKRLGEPEPYRKVALCLDTTSPVEGVEIVSVDEEHMVLSEFVRVLEEEKTDILMGWNTWQFDWKYLVGRQSVIVDDDGDSLVTFDLGRGGPRAGEVRTWELNSGAYGQNVYMLIRAPGVLDLDLMQLTKRDHKLDSYSLNNVSAKFLGDTKLDLPAHEIFKKFVGTADDRADIARYAIQDVCLPLRLFDKLCMFDNLAQMSVATCVPMDYLLSRGQQIKVYSLILQQARTLGYVLPDNKRITISGKFEGATVLDAKKGAYFEIISGLDFASLYPSIIRSYNMCYSTLVMPGSPVPADSYTVETGLGTYTFAQSPKGIVPQLLENLAVWRKNAKKKMAECKKNGDTFGANVWNGAQLAFKVSANSVYGFLGASKGFLPCVPIAASVTATGRNMIEKTKNLALKLVPGSDVVYGDSVASYTPIYIRISGKVQITTFEALAADLEWYVGMDGKEMSTPHDMETWSDIGWTRVERIIRHQHNANLIRVNTHTGLVDVTEHHSLLDHTGAMVKPTDINIGDRLLHAPLPVFEDGSDSHMNTDIAQIYGFFCGDGSCGRYKSKWGLKYSFAFNNADLELLKKYQSLCQLSFPDVIWVILDTMNSSGVYKLIPKSTTYGSIRDIVLLFREELYVNKSKVVPTKVLSSSVSIKEAFWKGLYDSDGIKSDSMRIDQKSQLSVATIIALFSELKYISSIHTHLDKKEIFRVTGSKSQRKDGSAIKKMFPVPYSGYVYDFSTANHHFSAGPGNLVVHNTDSVMVQFKVPPEHRHDMGYHFKIAEEVAQKISDTFPGCIELEFEKCYYPYLLYSKKRYAGLMYTKPEAPDYIDVKGLQLVRRDNAPIVKSVSQNILDSIMYDKSIDQALVATKKAILGMLSGECPMESFIVSKSLRGSYANPNSQPHVQVAKKIKERTGQVIESGARVPYVFVVDKDTIHQKLISQRAEDPEFAREHNLPLDYLYYLDNQIMSPVCALLEVLMDNPISILEAPEISRILTEMRSDRDTLVRTVKRVKKNEENRQCEITSFFKTVSNH